MTSYLSAGIRRIHWKKDWFVHAFIRERRIFARIWFKLCVFIFNTYYQVFISVDVIGANANFLIFCFTHVKFFYSLVLCIVYCRSTRRVYNIKSFLFFYIRFPIIASCADFIYNIEFTCISKAFFFLISFQLLSDTFKIIFFTLSGKKKKETMVSAIGKKKKKL